MTSEDRNRRMKYGHDVPRSWIAEFNTTHAASGPRQAKRKSADGGERSGRESLGFHYELKRRSRIGRSRVEIGRLNKDIRRVQKVLALLFAFTGLIMGGPIGLGIGVCTGLIIMLFRVSL